MYSQLIYIHRHLYGMWKCMNVGDKKQALLNI